MQHLATCGRPLLLTRDGGSTFREQLTLAPLVLALTAGAAAGGAGARSRVPVAASPTPPPSRSGSWSKPQMRSGSTRRRAQDLHAAAGGLLQAAGQAAFASALTPKSGKDVDRDALYY
uniref:Secreted protein n=1 Tax=Macrostomum lignano TaxID=282301 RepID=A0A1I8FBW9_9PLAT